ncbi:hypothetical protein B0T17DRAFT_525956 [Bombardia bombarda]|uniref:Uncharacterized protein n=1 Tax=Bombardia bombarda TaxID=252184 RepID=A0AA39X949_9PEZI|nr:hypothetical protein B0T17DRAFT_525956 [Bombardia bombarda]
MRVGVGVGVGGQSSVGWNRGCWPIGPIACPPACLAAYRPQYATMITGRGRGLCLGGSKQWCPFVCLPAHGGGAGAGNHAGRQVGRGPGGGEEM